MASRLFRRGLILSARRPSNGVRLPGRWRTAPCRLPATNIPIRRERRRLSPDLPTIVISYNGPQSGKGAAYSWDSKGKAGKGSLAITDAASPSRVNMRLDMEKPMEGHPNIVFALEPRGTATEVTWTMAGPHPYINRIFSMIFNMNKMIGGAFAAGLSDLKALAEK